MQVDGEHDFTAIWVFTPGNDGKIDFKVYKEFEIVGDQTDQNSILQLQPPAGGYGAVVHSATLTPNTGGSDDDDAQGDDGPDFDDEDDAADDG